MWIEKKMLSLLGWRYEIKIDLPDKCVVCIAPHTSNLDFLYGILFKRATRLNFNFFIKKEWMRFPFSILIKRLGGIAVHRDKNNSTTDAIAHEFQCHKILRLGVTPEGTRSRNNEWKSGFYVIAQKANVPIVLASLDYNKKLIAINKLIFPEGDIQKQMLEIKSYFKDVAAKYPQKFAV